MSVVHYREECAGHERAGGAEFLCDGTCEATECGRRGPFRTDATSDDVEEVTCTGCLASLDSDDSDDDDDDLTYDELRYDWEEFTGRRVL